MSEADPGLATSLLLEIANAQFHAKNPALVAGIRLGLKLEDREDGNASEVEFGLEYLVHPREIIALEIDDLDRGTSVQKGFDGRNYWLQEDQKDKQMLSGHEFGKDRESIDEAMDLCSDLMLMLDFRQLEKRNMPRAVLSHENGQRILVGDLKRQEGSKWRYHLWLSADELQPHRLEMAREVPVVVEQDELDTALEPVATTAIEYQRFELKYYKAFEGRSIPQMIELFNAPFISEADLPARLLEIHNFVWMSEDSD